MGGEWMDYGVRSKQYANGRSSSQEDRCHHSLLKQAIEEEIQLWGEAYDRSYLIQNVVFCPNCHKVSHFKDWGSDNKEK